MMHARQLFLRFGLAGLMTGYAAIAPISAANATSFSTPSLGTATAPLEKADWVPRCWWRQGLWGPQQVCQQVWVDSRYYNYGRGYDFGGGWDGRRHYHDEDDEEDDE